MKIDVKNCFYFFSFYNHICTEEKEMFNDIFYFVNASERNYLKEELQDLAGKKMLISNLFKVLLFKLNKLIYKLKKILVKLFKVTRIIICG